MRELVLVKYAPEIFVKGNNRGTFEKKLRDNIKSVLIDIKYQFINDSGRWFIASENLDEVVDRVKKVFGVAEVCIVTEVDADVEVIKGTVIKVTEELAQKHETFKVETNRANKKFPINSMEVSKMMGGVILRAYPNLSVNVTKPDFKVNVEIREKAYVYVKRIKGIGGLPYGMNGKTLLMLSGGIDSPVAGYLLGRRGIDVSGVYFHSHPYTSERAKDKVKELARIIKTYTGSFTLYIPSFTDIQMSIIQNCREDELTIIMRRFMMRLACRIAADNGIHSVATGESIGQVASQTMEGLVVSDDPADRPVFRPLIAMDKQDIIEISKEIGTYETSILPYEDCCTIFVPKHPKTKPILSHIIKSESTLDIDKLVNDSIETMEIVKI